MSSPPPLQPPTADYGMQHSRLPAIVPTSQQKSAVMQSNRNEGNSNLLSSQKFKNELAVKQARLSPNPDSQLSIDEKIRQRKAAERSAMAGRQQVENSKRMPDKLVNSSTLQRDKRPFAYSPDVNDPNNRGKLDLSQIKSPNMRRRLIANMEESPEEDENAELKQEASTRPSPNVTAIKHEFVPITLLDTDVPQPQPVYYTQPRPVPRVKRETPRPKPEPPKEPERSNAQVVAQPAPTIVHYREPPRFYTLQPDSCCECETRTTTQHQTRETSYLEALNTEVAASLESLSLLANNLDSDWGQRPAAHQNETQINSNSNQMDPLGQLDNSIYNNQYTAPTRYEQQANCPKFIQQAQTLSSFRPRDQDGRRIERIQETTTVTPGHQVPSFYSTLPSGRPVNSFCPLGDSTTDYFRTSPSSSGPYPIAPFYGSTLDSDEQASRNWSAVNNKPTSQRTLFADRNSAITSQYNAMNRQDVGRASNLHAQSTTTSHHWQDTSREDQVRTLREMTKKLQMEVSRLYNLDVTMGQR